MNTDERISVVINTRNAALHLERVLEAAKGFDEIVVCDMQSSDATLDIARRHGCKIVSFDPAGYTIAEPARTFAIQSASSKWVLVVDADEIITPELRTYLYSRISRDSMPAGLYICRHNQLFGAYSRSWSHDYQLRFFKREGTVWPPVVHSFPKVDGPVERAPAKFRLLHLADETTRQWITKMNDYTDNEMDKKLSRNFGIPALLLRPAWRFFANYILQGGFLNGRRGLLKAMQWAMYQQVLVSKIIEHDIRSKER